MRWVRTNIRFGARLAVLALAVQFVLSFSHVEIYRLPSAQQSLSTVVDGPTGAPSHPNKKNRSADFDCPICALIQLASTSAPSTAPELTLPAKLGLLKFEAPPQLALTISQHVLFEARAPPSA